MKTEPDHLLDQPTGTMERLLGKIGFDAEAKRPTVFTMESPIPEQGNDRTYLAHTDRLTVFLNVYSPNDGENKLPTHTNEDHAFIVLQGAAEFVGPNDEKMMVNTHQGIMVPRNCLYTFMAANNEALVMIRVGATVDADKSLYGRVLEDGTPLIGNSKENNTVPCVFKPGAFFS
jgi:mannose-6-phosphate isomerase-like protein (cupin superfamily)